MHNLLLQREREREHIETQQQLNIKNKQYKRKKEKQQNTELYLLFWIFLRPHLLLYFLFYFNAAGWIENISLNNLELRSTAIALRSIRIAICSQERAYNRLECWGGRLEQALLFVCPVLLSIVNRCADSHGHRWPAVCMQLCVSGRYTHRRLIRQ